MNGSIASIDGDPSSANGGRPGPMSILRPSTQYATELKRHELSAGMTFRTNCQHHTRGLHRTSHTPRACIDRRGLPVFLRTQALQPTLPLQPTETSDIATGNGPSVSRSGCRPAPLPAGAAAGAASACVTRIMSPLTIPAPWIVFCGSIAMSLGGNPELSFCNDFGTFPFSAIMSWSCVATTNVSIGHQLRYPRGI